MLGINSNASTTTITNHYSNDDQRNGKHPPFLPVLFPVYNLFFLVGGSVNEHRTIEFWSWNLLWSQRNEYAVSLPHAAFVRPFHLFRVSRPAFLPLD